MVMECESAENEIAQEDRVESARGKRRAQEETDEVVRENGIPFAINQHICED